MWPDVVAAALLAGGYWVVREALCGGGVRAVLKRVGLEGRPGLLGPLAAAAALLTWLWPWSAFPAGELYRTVALVLAGAVVWKAVTRDIDVVTGDAKWGSRLLAIAGIGALWLGPGALVLLLPLLSEPFDAWTHHGTLALRHLIALAAFTLLVLPAAGPVLGEVTAAPYVFFATTLHASHYFITALAKGWLGPEWYSWVTDNRLHHIAASAYSWGWARFVPRGLYRRWLRLLGALDRPFQAGAFALEAVAPLALLAPEAAAALAVGWTVFHVMVFVASGIFFWEWIVANGLLGWMALAAPDAVAATAFGPGAVVAGVVLMALLPLRGKLWEPRPLAWWDTPLTQRIRWRVRGVSGELYGLYNDFMCPHERLYGRVHGSFLLRRPVFTYHLGEVFLTELRDEIRACGGAPEEVDRLREEYGIVPYDREMEGRHLAYLRRFFQRLNEGARKHVLPRGLRWLKAPGEQPFYGGELPAYRRQEPVQAVEILYREEYWDGDRFRLLREDLLRSVEVPREGEAGSPRDPETGAGDGTLREVRDAEVDDLILSRASGKLVHFPGEDGDDGEGSRAGGSREGEPSA